MYYDNPHEVPNSSDAPGRSPRTCEGVAGDELASEVSEVSSKMYVDCGAALDDEARSLKYKSLLTHEAQCLTALFPLLVSPHEVLEPERQQPG
eukprot:13234638-Alexandrium_andersonii.AAC.2